MVLALREVVANGPTALTCGVPAAATVRAWRDRRRHGRAQAWIWTEPAAFGDAVAALLFTVAGPQGPVNLVQRVSLVVSIGLTSWWITGIRLRQARWREGQVL